MSNGIGKQVLVVTTVTNRGGSYWGFNQAAVIPAS
jgi:hypothetical protein